jgi:hypothetical protein
MTHNPDPVEALLRSAGPRPTAPADRARRVEAAVRLEWQDAVQKRIGRRRAALIAVSCLTSAAVIALVLHAHVAQVTPQATAPPARPGSARTAYVEEPRQGGSYFRANNEDRPADRGVTRHVLASYSWETR